MGKAQLGPADMCTLLAILGTIFSLMVFALIF